MSESNQKPNSGRPGAAGKKSGDKARRPRRPTAAPELFHDPGLLSRPIQVELRLASELAYNAADQLLPKIERDVRHLYHFAANRLRYDQRENRVDAMGNYIDNLIEGTLNPTLLQQRIDSVASKLSDVGYNLEDIYADEDNTFEFKGQMRSPHGRKFLEILRRIDQFEALRAVAYVYGLIPAKTHATDSWRSRRSLEKTANKLNRTATQARKRRINPLVDSGDCWGRTKQELKDLKEGGAATVSKAKEKEAMKPPEEKRRSPSSKSGANDAGAPAKPNGKDATAGAPTEPEKPAPTTTPPVAEPEGAAISESDAPATQQ